MSMYYVLVVEACEPKTIELNSKKQVEDFLSEFTEKYGSLNDGSDNWVDQIFEGNKLDIKIVYKVG